MKKTHKLVGEGLAPPENKRLPLHNAAVIYRNGTSRRRPLQKNNHPPPHNAAFIYRNGTSRRRPLQKTTAHRRTNKKRPILYMASHVFHIGSIPFRIVF
jgi:hypothetical protein